MPIPDSFVAAYRPIIFQVGATATSGGVPPVVYCDIYINGTYYKTLQKTQPESVGWQFDIQDACQEFLKSNIAPNGGSDIVPDAPALITVFCKFRSSGLDANGFILTEDTAPVQGTGSVPPASGTGTASSSLFVVNSTLQHEQNQSLELHTAEYEDGTWSNDAFPLTHRGLKGATYKVCQGDSDYFPILYKGSGSLSCIVVNYTLKDGTTGSVNTCGLLNACPVVTITGINPGDNGNGTQTFIFGWSTAAPLITTIGIQYRLNGSSDPYTTVLGSKVTGRTLTLPLGTYEFRLQMNGACDTSYSGTSTAGIDPPECVPVDADTAPVLDEAIINTAYDYILPVTGDAPITVTITDIPSWMTVTPGSSTHLTGTPLPGDQGTAIPVQFTLHNACGDVVIDTTIDVIDGTHFGDTIFVFNDADKDYEIAPIVGTTGQVVIVTMDNYINSNGGLLSVDGINESAIGTTFNKTLDGSGYAELSVNIDGAPNTGTVMMAHFTITFVNSGVIGSQDTFQISKIF